jgi:adenylosuccinate lyase
MADFSAKALSPLDGRYADSVRELAEVFGEHDLVRKRIQVEVEYLLALTAALGVADLRSGDEELIRTIVEGFDGMAFERVKQIEQETHHDVKAAESYLAERLQELGLAGLVRWVHFGLTSEDVNNIAQTLQLREGSRILLDAGSRMQAALAELIGEGSDAVMLARTHGQPAVPTTMGKELLVFGLQLQELLEELHGFEYRGKMTGAVGTLAAHKAAFPNVDWLGFSRTFVRSFGLEPEVVTTQVLPPTNWMRLFSLLQRLSLVVISLAKNLWWYTTLGYFRQKVIEKEVGSSTMPQKVNPIFLENAEGNGQLAAALFAFLVEKFSHTRLQRDLSDSTLRRNFGVAFGHLYLSLSSLTEGLARLEIDAEAMLAELREHPEVLAEAVQVILRREGVEDAYEAARRFFRGAGFDREAFIGWVEGQLISEETKQDLIALDAADYIGVARQLVDSTLDELKQRIRALAEGR